MPGLIRWATCQIQSNMRHFFSHIHPWIKWKKMCTAIYCVCVAPRAIWTSEMHSIQCDGQTLNYVYITIYIGEFCILCCTIRGFFFSIVRRRVASQSFFLFHHSRLRTKLRCIGFYFIKMSHMGDVMSLPFGSRLHAARHPWALNVECTVSSRQVAHFTLQHVPLFFIIIRTNSEKNLQIAQRINFYYFHHVRRQKKKPKRKKKLDHNRNVIERDRKWVIVFYSNVRMPTLATMNGEASAPIEYASLHPSIQWVFTV